MGMIWFVSSSFKYEKVACTTEAKQCPDGSYVGRITPTCDFAECPAAVVTDDGDNADNRCNLKPDTGPCKALFKKYYFNQEEKTCQEFVWGGCLGVVPFETLENCQKECVYTRINKQITQCAEEWQEWVYARNEKLYKRPWPGNRDYNNRLKADGVKEFYKEKGVVLYDAKFEELEPEGHCEACNCLSDTVLYLSIPGVDLDYFLKLGFNTIANKQKIYKEISERSGWQTYKNRELNYEFDIPANWAVPQMAEGDPNMYFFGTVNGTTHWLTIGFISQDSLNRMGISYCGAYPEDTRCEVYKINDNLGAAIDWGLEEDNRIKASAWISHPSGGIVTLEFKPITPDIKSIIYEILKTFQFIDSNNNDAGKSYQ